MDNLLDSPEKVLFLEFTVDLIVPSPSNAFL